MLCLARGLLKLRNSNVLILDEVSTNKIVTETGSDSLFACTQSTANLDHDTDVAVQQTIREELGASTILCIAREPTFTTLRAPFG